MGRSSSQRQLDSLRFIYYFSFLFIMHFSPVAAMLLYRDKNRTNEILNKVKQKSLIFNIEKRAYLCSKAMSIHLSIHEIVFFFFLSWLESLIDTWLGSFVNCCPVPGDHTAGRGAEEPFPSPHPCLLLVSTQQRSRGIIAPFRGNTAGHVDKSCLPHQLLQMVQTEGSRGLRSCTPYSKYAGRSLASQVF